MANNFSFAVNGSNATLAFQDGGHTYRAQVRVKTLAYNYGVTSEESHARDERAFYPHRRVQGQFKLVIDCIHYKEFRQLMTWLRAYTDTLLDRAMSSSSQVAIMDVTVPARGFHKMGILTTGIDDHDQTGSMVFNPELVFLTLADPTDTVTSLLSTSQVSTFQSPQVDANATTAFYPVTAANYKDQQLYDDFSAVDKNAAVRAAVAPAIPTPPNVGLKQQILQDEVQANA